MVPASQSCLRAICSPRPGPPTVKGGTGLGLTIVSEIVRLHGGTISLDEAATTGTCFRITIPDRHQQEEPR